MMLITSGCSFYAPKAPAIPSDIQSNPATLRVDNFFIPDSHKLGFWFYAQNADKILITGEVNRVNALYRELRKSGATARITQQYSSGLTTITFYKD